MMPADNKTDRLLIHDIGEMREYASAAFLRGESIGLVPTMGALHEGHLSLIRRSAGENDRTIVSVFVNPLQFDDPGDLTSYPKTLEDDVKASAGAGADVVFAPQKKQMYPDGFSTYVDMAGLTDRLCGASRPSHFRGVLTVVNKLFGICKPKKAYFGEKDAQQLAVIKKMAAELDTGVQIIGCPTIREKDGLAMSSRNTRLSAEERIEARCLSRAMYKAKKEFDTGNKNIASLLSALRSEIRTSPGIRIDYAEIVDPDTLKTPPDASEGDLVMLAVFIGNTRLIDNMRL